MGLEKVPEETENESRAKGDRYTAQSIIPHVGLLRHIARVLVGSRLRYANQEEKAKLGSMHDETWGKIFLWVR